MNKMPSKVLSGHANSAAVAQRPAPALPLLRQFKVLQPGHSPAQLSLFLRPSGAR
jgi:hypothetical protein